MSRLVDVADSNRYLFDLLFRHQVYLEGVKAGFNQRYRVMLTQLYGEFAKYVGMTKYDQLDAFTKREITEFIRRFTLAQTHSYNQYTQQLIELLKQFVDVDNNVSNQIYQAITGSDRTIAPPSWSKVSNSIVPANGMTIEDTLQVFGDSSQAKVGRMLMMGYANGDSTKAALSDIVGNPDLNYRDGAFATFSNQMGSIMATLLQHTSSQVQSSIAGEFYASYQWVSVLDNRTSEICRDRNGKMYVYGDGPLPPAHYNCRSKAVALTQGDEELHDIPDTFYGWLRTQPEALLLDMIGTTAATKVIAGTLGMQSMSINDVVIPLTLEQFQQKISNILM